MWRNECHKLGKSLTFFVAFRQPPNLLEPLIHSLAPPKPRSGARPKLVEPTHITTKRATLGSRGSIFLDDHVQNMAGYAKT